MAEKHDILGGKVHVYRRENSGKWQCSTFLNGRNWRVSTKHDSLSHAKDFAEDWYLELRGKSRAGILETKKHGKTFKETAEKHLAEAADPDPGATKRQIRERAGQRAQGHHPAIPGQALSV